MKTLKRVRNDILRRKGREKSKCIVAIWNLIFSIKALFMVMVEINATNRKIIFSVLLYVLTIIGVFFTVEKKKNICIIGFISILFDTIIAYKMLLL